MPIVPGTAAAGPHAGGGARLRRQGRLPGDDQGVGGRRRARHARRAQRRRARRAARARRAREAGRRSATTRCFSRSWSCGRKHIEVQVLGDTHGNLVHLFERDCSVQRRHQKVVEYAPAWSLPPALRARLADDALKVARKVNYANAGTVEFLVGEDGAHYFIEVNPRIQVEHTVTEAITGRDLVQAQIRDRAGLPARGPRDRHRQPGRHRAARRRDPGARDRRGSAQRLPPRHRQDHRLPTCGRARHPARRRLGLRRRRACPPYYDSLLVKITASGLEWNYARRKVVRSLREFRIRGVKTNLAFLENVLPHPTFEAGKAHTTFIDETPELMQYSPRRDRATRHPALRRRRRSSTATRRCAASRSRRTSVLRPSRCRRPRRRRRRRPGPSRSWITQGPSGIVRMLRAERRVRLTDTTWRDAHQSLLATRLRTYDIAKVAHATAPPLLRPVLDRDVGGATFDVAYRFLSEDPWLRLEELRKLVPEHDVPDAAARGERGRLHELPRRRGGGVHRGGGRRRHRRLPRSSTRSTTSTNMQVAIEAAQKTGRSSRRRICYTGDVARSEATKYDLKYYVDMAKELVNRGTHLLAIKDMAGLLKPRAAHDADQGAPRRRRRAAAPAHARHLRQQHRDLHGRDRGGHRRGRRRGQQHGRDDRRSPRFVAGVRAAGDAARPRMAPEAFEKLSTYWEPVRAFYAPFESGLKAPRRRRVRARDARRAVLEPARAGRGAGRRRRAGRRSSAPTPRSTSCSATSSR